jgi:glycosyltransferase involved in cell wall biosynthesis
MADSLSAILHRPVGTIGNAPGIDLSLAPASDRGKAQIIAVGTIEPRKNYDAVLDLAEALPAPWRVQIVGRRGWGPDRGNLGQPPGAPRGPRGMARARVGRCPARPIPIG